MKMDIAQKRDAVVESCRQFIEGLSESELDSALKDPEHFHMLLRFPLTMSRLRGHLSDPEHPDFREDLRRRLTSRSSSSR